MSNVTMWWAGTNWSWDTPFAVVEGPDGLLISGALSGPPNPNPFSLGLEFFSILITAEFWLGPDRVPPTGCEWRSLAVDKSTGSVSATTFGGIVFGDSPVTSFAVTRTHRVFSGSTMLLEEEFQQNILDVTDQNTTMSAALPQFGVFSEFSSKTFDFDRSKGLSIELQLKLGVGFFGGGTFTFDGVNVALPQFDITSQL